MDFVDFIIITKILEEIWDKSSVENVSFNLSSIHVIVALVNLINYVGTNESRLYGTEIDVLHVPSKKSEK